MNEYIHRMTIAAFPTAYVGNEQAQFMCACICALSGGHRYTEESHILFVCICILLTFCVDQMRNFKFCLELFEMFDAVSPVTQAIVNFRLTKGTRWPSYKFISRRAASPPVCIDGGNHRGTDYFYHIKCQHKCNAIKYYYIDCKMSWKSLFTGICWIDTVSNCL